MFKLEYNRINEKYCADQSEQRRKVVRLESYENGRGED